MLISLPSTYAASKLGPKLMEFIGGDAELAVGTSEGGRPPRLEVNKRSSKFWMSVTCLWRKTI